MRVTTFSSDELTPLVTGQPVVGQANFGKLRFATKTKGFSFIL